MNSAVGGKFHHVKCLKRETYKKGKRGNKMENIVVTYDYYTLDQAREIIRKENRIKRDRARRKKKRILKYYLKQKAIGLAVIILSILTATIIKDATLSVLAVPLGLYLIFTKNHAI